jgi:hypothetical protein
MGNKGKTNSIGKTESNMSPLDFLRAVMNNHKITDKDRIRAAIAAARYSHKLGDRNAKEEKDAKAKKAGSGKFTSGKKPQQKAVK